MEPSQGTSQTKLVLTAETQKPGCCRYMATLSARTVSTEPSGRVIFSSPTERHSFQLSCIMAGADSLKIPRSSLTYFFPVARISQGRTVLTSLTVPSGLSTVRCSGGR